MVRTKFNPQRSQMEKTLKEMNANLRRPILSSRAKWVSCDLCGRNPISAWHFKEVGAAGRDVCYPCYRKGAPGTRQLYFMGWAPRIPRANVTSEDLAATSSDEEAGIHNEKSLRFQRDESPATASDNKGPKRVPKGPAKRKPQAGKKGPTKREVASDGGATASSSSTSSSSSSDDSDSDDDVAILTQAKVPRPPAPRAAKGKKAPVPVVIKPAPRPAPAAQKSPVAAPSQPDVGEGPSQQRGRGKKQSFLASGAEGLEDELKAALNHAHAQAVEVRGAASQVEDESKAAPTAKAPTRAAKRKDESAVESSTVTDLKTHRSEEVTVAAEKTRSPKTAPKKVPSPKAAAIPPPDAAIPAPPAAAAPVPPPLSASPSVGDSASSPASPVTRKSSATAPTAEEPMVIKETPVVKFFRGFGCHGRPHGAIDPSDAAGTFNVHGNSIRAGESCIVRPQGGQTHFVMGAYGKVASVRIIPTLASEGFWISALVKGAAGWSVMIWQLETHPDRTQNTPQLKGVVFAGQDAILGYEWLPLPIHNDEILGFASILKPQLVMSGLIPKSYPPTMTITNRVCGLTSLQQKELDPVGLRWIAHERDVERTYLAIVHRCSTVVVYVIVNAQSSQQLTLSARHRFPAPKAALPRISGAPVPMVVGVRPNGETFVSVAHGQIALTIEGGTQLHSVAALDSAISAIAATPRGLYCALENGRTQYVRANGRDQAVDELTMPSMASGVFARSRDIVVGTSSGVVAQWAPPKTPQGVVHVDVKGNDVMILNSPDCTVAAVGSGVNYAFHPVEASSLARYCVAWTASGVLAILDVPLPQP